MKKYKNSIVFFSFFLFFTPFFLSPLFAQSDSDYIVKYFVDDFGDPTDHKYLFTMVTGKFSNSATKDSTLNVGVIISDIEISFMLFEYGSSRVIGSDYTSYVLKMKFPDGQIFEKTTKIDKYTSRLILSKLFDSSIDFETLFSGSAPMKIFIYEKDRPYTNYSFTIKFPSKDYIKNNLGSDFFWIQY
jgi:hypothetical protein